MLIIRLALGVILVYLGGSTVIANQTIASFKARVPLTETPASHGLPYEDVSFNSRIDNLTLRGWYIEGNSSSTIIIVPGGSQNRADETMDLLGLYCELARVGYNILAFDRRGCGESDEPCFRDQSHFERDVGGAVDYVRSRTSGKLFVWGTSLGAVANIVYASEETGIDAMISDSCFARTSEMLSRELDKTWGPLVVFTPGTIIMGKLVYGFEIPSPVGRVSSVECPVFFIHGEADDAVPEQDVYDLLQNSNNPLDELWVVPEANHSQAYKAAPEEYLMRVTRFLEKFGKETD